MKKLLSKMFFLSNSARGMLFALTLVTVGNYLWFSLFYLFLLWNGKTSWILILLKDEDRLLWIPALVALPITLYSLALAVVALVGLTKNLRRERRFKALWHLLPAGLCLALGAVGAVRVFPPLYLMQKLGLSYDDGMYYHDSWVSVGFPGLPPEYWAAVFFISLLLILAGGLFLTATFAAAEGKKFRSAFGAATLSVWGVFALWYLFTLGLAIRESREVAAVHQAVEKRFGRPLTAAGLEKLYRENGKIDAEFWPREEKLRAALPKVKLDKKDDEDEAGEVDFWELDLPDRPTAATLAWYANYCRANRAALETYENCFDRELPLPEKRFVRGDLAGILLPTLAQGRHFVRALESSRMVYFLAVRDADAAWACYRRIGSVCAYLQKEPFLIGGLVWLAVEQNRLDCVEKLLESRLLADAKLDELDADLAALERDIPRDHRQSMYSEAVFGQDAIAGLEDGLLDLAYELSRLKNPPGAFAPYRWIFPQWWYYAAMDKKTILQIYLLPDFTHFSMAPVNKMLLMSNILLPAFEQAGNRFYALTARTRGMRALIRAEKYRRKHGEFPKTLADLPPDPFTGKPLVYTVGKMEIIETVWKKTVDMGNGIMRTAEVVQILSDPETTARLKVRRPKSFEDPTRAMIRY